MTRILALIDFSDYSKTLMSLALHWKKSLPAELWLLHQIPGAAPALADQSTRAEILQLEKDESVSKLKQICGSEELSNIRFVVSEWPLSQMIDECRIPDGLTLVLAGLKGTGLLRQVLLGSTINRVMEETDATILALPLGMPAALPSQLTVAVNPRFPLNVPALKELLKAFSGPLRKLEFISVVRSDDREDECAEYLQELGAEFEETKATWMLFKGEHVLAEIKSHMASQEGAFLCVQMGSRALTDKLFRRFIINELVYEGTTPLIVLPK